MKIFSAVSAALLSVGLFVPVTSHAQVRTTTTTAHAVGTEEYNEMTATVTAVELETRTVTLKGQDGAETTLVVSDAVKRLAEVKVGDQLVVSYLASVGLDFRAPTAEEMKEPYKELKQTEKADAAHAPASATQRTIRAVVTVEGMSRLLNALTVKGPRGNYLVIEVAPGMVKWEELRIGQTMVGTYTEAVVVAIEPAAKK